MRLLPVRGEIHPWCDLDSRRRTRALSCSLLEAQAKAASLPLANQSRFELGKTAPLALPVPRLLTRDGILGEATISR